MNLEEKSFRFMKKFFLDFRCQGSRETGERLGRRRLRNAVLGRGRPALPIGARSEEEEDLAKVGNGKGRVALCCNPSVLLAFGSNNGTRLK